MVTPHDRVSGLSSYLRHRLILESEVIGAVWSAYPPTAVEKLVAEVLWRTYCKGWLEFRPQVWGAYLGQWRRDWDGLDGPGADRHAAAVAGRTGMECFDSWVGELIATGYLHNHARMWLVSIWIFTLRLPWTLGAAFVLRHLLDGDPASNTLSWRWVAGLHTRGKHYLARAKNIARYTDGRFDPQGQLDEQAGPLTEPELDLRPRPLAERAPPYPVGASALLLTPEDLTPERSPIAGFRFAGVAGGWDQGVSAELDLAPAVAAFPRDSLDDALSRAAAHFGVPAGCLDETAWLQSAEDWARGLGVSQVVALETPVGPWAERVERLACRLAPPGDPIGAPPQTLGLHALARGHPGLLPLQGARPRPGQARLSGRPRGARRTQVSRLMTPIQIVWFKRDLRVLDHPALAAAARHGPVLPLYIAEPGLWAQPDAAGRHWAFVAECLAELWGDLAALGQPLVVRLGEAIPVLEGLLSRLPIGAFWSHEETGNAWTYDRDRAVGRFLRARGIPWHELPQNGVVRALPSRDRWSRTWERRMGTPLEAAPALRPLGPGLGPPGLGTIPSARDLGLPEDPCPGRQRGGRRAGVAALEGFLMERGQGYHREMSSPLTAFDACSRLSPHLAWGSLSIREVVQATRLRRDRLAGLPPRERGTWGRALAAFEGRLHWHCHFIQKLESAPRIEIENMQRACDGLRDPVPDPDQLAAWCAGRTGFPLVDACMRALAETGWINFRMRALLVSFSSYQLWQHWREPGLHLARLFTDYEPGIHWSQVQMQSGTTGINTLRIYNPVKQSEDQDPQGLFIRRWVPELAGVPGERIHQPWRMSLAEQVAAGCRIGFDYPAPIVDHLAAAREARRRLGTVRRTAQARAEGQSLFLQHGSRRRGGASAGKRAGKGAGRGRTGTGSRDDRAGSGE